MRGAEDNMTLVLLVRGGVCGGLSLLHTLSGLGGPGTKFTAWDTRLTFVQDIVTVASEPKRWIRLLRIQNNTQECLLLSKDQTWRKQ